MWTVPADRMKAKREHRVPLASRAMEVLTEARRLADDSGLMLPSITGRVPLGANTLTKLSHELRLGCTALACEAASGRGAARRSNHANWLSRRWLM